VAAVAVQGRLLTAGPAALVSGLAVVAAAVVLLPIALETLVLVERAQVAS
jgi:hypothetical protein